MDDWTRRARAFWDAQAAADPLWAVLTHPERKARQWRLDDFMRNGEREVALLFHELERLGFGRRFASALDFGCGVGRVTQALARRCDCVLGIDISPRMVAIAEALNAYPGAVRYVSLDLDGVRRMASGIFDLIYSNIVLQHIEPERTLEYLGELSRLLRPHGALVFQLPSHRRQSSDPLIRPMPDGAYRAELRVLEPLPAALEAGRQYDMAVRVVNAGNSVWSQPDVGSIRLGNHWFDEPGRRLLVQDDGRAVLPQALVPGATSDAILSIHAPERSGRYCLEIDVVHEGVSWFADRGSQSLRVVVPVVERDTPQEREQAPTIAEYEVPHYSLAALESLLGASGAGNEGAFPMYGVPQEQVLELIRSRGGRLVRVEDGNRAGPEWIDYRYFVRAL
jgi:SAM-dependent methyltransferase